MSYIVESKKYKGIEYVQLNDLPVTQQVKIKETLSRDFFIKILVNEKLITECIQYRHYTDWFTNVYQATLAKPTGEVAGAPQEVNHVSRFELNKA